MAYSSDINLPLAQEPKTADMNVWPDFLDVYNSIHILAQLLNRIRQGSGDANTPPWEAMPFERWFYAPAAEGIKAGNVVTIVNVAARYSMGDDDIQYTGVVKGGPIYSGYNYSTRSSSGQFTSTSYGTGLIGIALEDCVKDSLCKVGVGPAILQVEGTNIGDTIMALEFAAPSPNAPIFSGIMIANPDDQRGLMINEFLSKGGLVIGYGVAKDAVLINPSLDYAGQLSAREAWDTPFVPVSGDSP